MFSSSYTFALDFPFFFSWASFIFSFIISILLFVIIELLFYAFSEEFVYYYFLDPATPFLDFEPVADFCLLFWSVDVELVVLARSSRVFGIGTSLNVFLL